jgi:acetate kinase
MLSPNPHSSLRIARRVLVLNTGSSTLKWDVLDAATESLIDRATVTWPDDQPARRQQEIEAALARAGNVDAVGHRVVHGGSRYVQAVRIDDTVRDDIAELSHLAPLHNPHAVAGIDAARHVLPSLPHVAAFDTAFHATMPSPAAQYALPWAWTERWDVRRFGFHGLSVEYATRRVGELLGRVPARLVVCHFGAGCSVTAVANGRSIDTSMGFTPLEGMMMARRSGSVDPGVLMFLLRENDLTVAELDTGLNEQAGLLGVSGVSVDLREVVAAADGGNARAQLAVDMFVHRAAATVGWMVASLGGLDALVFTAGIGENSPLVRQRLAERFAYAGVVLDDAANTHVDGDTEVSGQGASVRAFVIAAREDLTILRQVKRLVWPD